MIGAFHGKDSVLRESAVPCTEHPPMQTWMIKPDHPVIGLLDHYCAPCAWRNASPLLGKEETESFFQQARNITYKNNAGSEKLLAHPDVVGTCGYTIPSSELLETLHFTMAREKKTKLLDIGAGTGYLAKVASLSGLETVATDVEPSSYFRYTAIEELDAISAQKKYPDHALLISRPMPSTAYGIPLEVMGYMIHNLKPNDVFFAICNADKTFCHEHTFLEAAQKVCKIEAQVPLPSFHGGEKVFLNVLRKRDQTSPKCQYRQFLTACQLI